MLSFNVESGYLEGLVRGYRAGLLTTADYSNLTQCDSLEDIKLHLSGTAYGDFLANDPPPLRTTTILDRSVALLVRQIEHIHTQAVDPVHTFMDYVKREYQIQNVILLITGTLHERSTEELMSKCHPLGTFPAMAALTSANSVADLYHLVLVDTPLAPYFQNCLSEEDLSEMSIELIRNTLAKAYLEDFYAYCRSMGGTTWDVMKELLEFEADRRAINITINSFGTELTKDDRERLFPKLGVLYPEGHAKLARAEDLDAVRIAVDPHFHYRRIFAQAQHDADKTLEDAFFEREVALNKLAFDRQFGLGVFYAYLKLKEQEIRNVVWVAECVAQRQKHRANAVIPIF